MSKRILIVGGVAGGATAASRARRLDAQAEIIIFERGNDVSFSNCSLPYHLGGTVPDSSALVLMDPVRFKKQYNIDVCTRTEVTAVDRAAKTVTVRQLDTGLERTEPYDVLILSTGANPIMPRSIAGIDSPHVFAVRNVTDIVKLKEYASRPDIRTVAVIGGGFIGIEVAENLVKMGRDVTLVEAADQVMAPFDYDMAQLLHKEMLDNGIQLILGDGVREVRRDDIVLASGRTVECQAVVMSIGVTPENTLAKQAGLELGAGGAVKVDHCFRTSDKNIYAVGDVIETFNRMTNRPGRAPLAGPAQRQARNAADHIYGIPHQEKGAIGSSIVRVFGLNAAVTGLTEKAAREAGIPYGTAYVIPFDKVSIMPDRVPLYFKLLYEDPTGRVLGAQCISAGCADKRVDVIAAVISLGGTLEDLKELELCYAPMYSTARDAVNQAALVALNVLNGVIRQVPVSAVRKLVESGACFVDLRERPEFQAGHIRGAMNIPLSELYDRLEEVPRDRPVYLYCRSGQRSYNAYMALKNRGYTDLYNVAGSFLGLCQYEYFNDAVSGREPVVTGYNFL